MKPISNSFQCSHADLHDHLREKRKHRERRRKEKVKRRALMAQAGYSSAFYFDETHTHLIYYSYFQKKLYHKRDTRALRMALKTREPISNGAYRKVISKHQLSLLNFSSDDEIAS